MTPDQFERSLKSGRPAPVILLHGPEPHQRQRVENLVKSLVSEGMEDFNFLVLQADETPAAEVAAQAQTLPFMTPPRVMLVRGVDRYPADQQDVLKQYISHPNDSTLLVLIADKPDWRLKFFKWVKDQGIDVACDPPSGRELAGWVREAMAKRGMTMGAEAARTLIDRVGTDLADLEMELEKVYLYALGRPEALPEDVMAVSRRAPTANVFELGDAAAGQDPTRALAALKDLTTTDAPLMILAMLVRHFRLLLKAKLIQLERTPRSEMARILGVPPFVQDKYLDQARDLSLAQIKKGLAGLKQANLTLVTSPAPPELVLGELVLGLATLRRSDRIGL
jgi:DNA polymerase-3 subunit delta